MCVPSPRHLIKHLIEQWLALASLLSDTASEDLPSRAGNKVKKKKQWQVEIRSRYIVKKGMDKLLQYSLVFKASEKNENHLICEWFRVASL